MLSKRNSKSKLLCSWQNCFGSTLIYLQFNTDQLSDPCANWSDWDWLYYWCRQQEVVPMRALPVNELIAALWGGGSSGGSVPTAAERRDRSTAHLLQKMQRRRGPWRWLLLHCDAGGRGWRCRGGQGLEQGAHGRNRERAGGERVQWRGDTQLEVVIHWDVWSQHL